MPVRFVCPLNSAASETALPEWRDVYGIWWTLYVALFVIAFFTLFAITIWLVIKTHLPVYWRCAVSSLPSLPFPLRFPRHCSCSDEAPSRHSPSKPSCCTSTSSLYLVNIHSTNSIHPPFFPPSIAVLADRCKSMVDHTGRLVWLIDPEDFNDLLNSAVRALLLRFPQTLQLVQVLLYIFLWYKLHTRTRERTREHRQPFAAAELTWPHHTCRHVVTGSALEMLMQTMRRSNHDYQWVVTSMGVSLTPALCVMRCLH